MTQGTPQIGDDPDTAIPPTKLSSIWIPIAKGCGQVLNFNCALIVVPVITELLHWLHDVKVQQGREEEGTAHKGSETTLSKYVPLGKNITFHRYIAYAVALNVFVHTLAHFINYSTHPGETRRAYSINKLQFLPESLGVIRALEAWYTGVIIIVCMVFMYSAAQVTPPIQLNPVVSCRLFLGPGFRLGARWNRLIKTVKTRKKRDKTGKKWARYGLKGVKEGSSPRINWQSMRRRVNELLEEWAAAQAPQTIWVDVTAQLPYSDSDGCWEADGLHLAPAGSEKLGRLLGEHAALREMLLSGCARCCSAPGHPTWSWSCPALKLRAGWV